MADLLLITVPEYARAEWGELTEALAVSGPVPCERDPDDWWSGQPERVAAAVAGCQGCPVLEECRAYGLVAGERWGTWGGMSAEERRQLAADVA